MNCRGARPALCLPDVEGRRNRFKQRRYVEIAGVCPVVMGNFDCAGWDRKKRQPVVSPIRHVLPPAAPAIGPMATQSRCDRRADEARKAIQQIRGVAPSVPCQARGQASLPRGGRSQTRGWPTLRHQRRKARGRRGCHQGRNDSSNCSKLSYGFINGVDRGCGPRGSLCGCQCVCRTDTARFPRRVGFPKRSSLPCLLHSLKSCDQRHQDLDTEGFQVSQGLQCGLQDAALPPVLAHSATRAQSQLPVAPLRRGIAASQRATRGEVAKSGRPTNETSWLRGPAARPRPTSARLCGRGV
jgi:hypothetical protein